MPREESEDPRERIYKLWFEFLHLSKDYKDFCAWKRRQKRGSSLKTPGKFKKAKLTLPFIVGYSHFGDISKTSFDDWWALKKNLFLASETSRSVDNFTNLFRTEMENEIEEFKFEEGRDPSLNEFKRIVIGLIDSPKRVIISVTLTGTETAEDLSLQCAELIKNSKPKFNFKSHYWRRAWRFPTSTKRIDQLQRYLEVYRLSLEGHSTREIAGQIEYYSDHRSDLLERHRMIRSDIKKAKGIMKNVEEGIFPGKY